MLKVPHGVGIGRIRKQYVAVWRPAGHRAKIECHRIRAAAVHDVARVNDQALLSHGDREIAPAAERLADGGHALQQRLVFEQRYERDRWSVELIEATNGARSAEGWAPRLLGSLTHQSATEPRPNHGFCSSAVCGFSCRSLDLLKRNAGDSDGRPSEMAKRCLFLAAHW